MLAGHFEVEGAFLDQRYPEVLDDPDFRLITFVRNPIEIPQSMHFYARKNKPGYSVPSVSYRVANGRNVLATLLRCDELNYREVIDRYFFVGSVERLQESLDVLADLLEKPPVKVPVLNSAPRDEVLTPEEEAQFLENNQLDDMIYRYCWDTFSSRLAEVRSAS